MIAFGWRQFRAQAMVGIAGLVVIGIVLIVTGPHLVNVYDTALAACKASGGTSSACNNPVSSTYAALQKAATVLVLVVPALLGMFWGAPLIAHELETGTFRLAWTQSVSRRRWLFVKLGLVGLATMVAAGLLSLMVTWWISPVDMNDPNRFSPSNFALHGFVPAGYALFAFALAATLGLLIRRTLPAMALTLAGFVGARLAVTYWIRPHYMSAARATLPLTQADGGLNFAGPGAGGAISVTAQTPQLPNAWVTGANVVNKSGQAPASGYLRHACASAISAGQQNFGLKQTSVRSGGLSGGNASSVRVGQDMQTAMNQCFHTLSAHYNVVVSYQPANRFWTFQTIETALFVVLAVALAGVCAWWVRHRVT
jgi:ABC-type transport system involved in multi-copper enzyme maturation permease subunit